MFGQTVDKLMLYLAPLEASDFINYGYSNINLEALLDEKALIVYSYLPPKYQTFYSGRVYRLILEKSAYSGQTTKQSPIVNASNITGYLNPSADDFDSSDTIAIVNNAGTLEFTARDRGDVIVIDFDCDMSTVDILALVWAVNALAAIDLMSIISGDTKGASILPRVESDSKRVIPWLEALKNINDTDRIRIRELEYEIFQATDFLSLFRKLAKAKTSGII